MIDSWLIDRSDDWMIKAQKQRAANIITFRAVISGVAFFAYFLAVVVFQDRSVGAYVAILAFFLTAWARLNQVKLWQDYPNDQRKTNSLNLHSLLMRQFRFATVFRCLMLGLMVFYVVLLVSAFVIAGIFSNLFLQTISEATASGLLVTLMYSDTWTFLGPGHHAREHVPTSATTSLAER